MRKKTRQLLAAGMAFVMTWSSFGMTAPVYAEMAGSEQTEAALKASDSNAEDSRAWNVASDADAGKAPEESVVPETKTAQKEQIALFASGKIEGTGTVSDPYLIADADDWKAVMSKENQTYNRYGNLQGHIALSSDIDLSGETWDAENLNGKTFDGRGHKISGIGQPLFNGVSGTVKNLILTDADISETGSTKHIGAIARYSAATTNIQNCVVTGAIANDNHAAGGLVGNCQGTTNISNCFVQADIVNTGTNNNYSLSGGLVGLVNTSNQLSVENCIVLGNVSTNTRSGCGGLVGGRGRKVSISQSAALQKTVTTSVEYTTFVGRIFGYNDGSNYVSGAQNYAYAGMTGGANGNFPANESGNGMDVSGEDCLKADFWNNTIGWGNDANWEIADGQLPILKTSGLSPAVDLTDGEPPVYLGGTKELLSSPENVRWDDTVKGKAVWDKVENAAGYQVQLYKDSEELSSAETASGQTSYDFTSEIRETGSYTFTVKALGDENHEDSAEAVSGEYKFTAQSLLDVKTAAENVLKEMTVTNETTAADILGVVEDVITNKSISAAWSAENKFALTEATDGAEPGRSGGITGTIVLTLQKEGAADQTMEIIVDLTILPKFKVTFESGDETAIGTAPTMENTTEGTLITLPENTFTVYEKAFAGWSVGEDVYPAGSEYRVPGGNVTFTATWKDDVWDGSTKKEPKREDGYYLITTGAELAWFQGGAHAIGKAKLVCDIDLGYQDFVPISNGVAEFDGCGHTIRGLKAVNDGAYAGLFKTVSGNCLIKDLVIKEAKAEPASGMKETEIGILMSAPTSAVTLKNCYVSGTIIGNGNALYAGGLIGHVRSMGSVKMDSCYADVEITGTSNKEYAGGLVGYADGTTEIDNSYAVVNMDIDQISYAGGLVGVGRSNLTIHNSYAVGEKLTGKWIGGAVSGIANGGANGGTITNSVSIFPEMISLNRISNNGTLSGNYGFVGTTVRDKNGKILMPEADKTGADRTYGADASADELRSQDFYENTLGWDFTDVWTMMSSEDGYVFPVLKGQKESMLPTLSMDIDPEVVGISLDQPQAMIYPRGSVKLTATVDSRNGASRDVLWESSDPSVVRVSEDGTVEVHKDAADGAVYKVTAVSRFDATKQAESIITVDSGEHELNITRTDKMNSERAKVEVYQDADSAVGDSNDPAASGTGKPDDPVELNAAAGTYVYLKFTELDYDDFVMDVTVTGKDGKSFKAEPYCENPVVYRFIMPCGGADVKVEYATDITHYQHAWIVVYDWSNWGTTATFTTKSWENNNIGTLEVTNIITGKMFEKFDLEIFKYKGIKIEPKEVSGKDSLKDNGDYCVEKDPETGLPTLYVYLDGPGTITAEIIVKDDPDAEYNITKRAETSDYYELDKAKAKAGETVTATLTEKGIERLNQNPKENAVFTYEGGLNIVINAPRFRKNSDGTWTASIKMPACDIKTNVSFGDKMEMKTPAAPTAESIEENTVTLAPPTTFADGTAIPDYRRFEYRLGEGEWQDSEVFTGLLADTEYRFYVRIKEEWDTAASVSSEALVVRTKASEPDTPNPDNPNPDNPNPDNPNPDNPNPDDPNPDNPNPDTPNPDTPNPNDPTPAKPGTSSNSTDDSDDYEETASTTGNHSEGTWKKDQNGWWYELRDGRYIAGSYVTDPESGTRSEHVAWRRIDGAWWAFGVDGYLKTGWIWDAAAGKWYYVDEKHGMLIGWYLDPQDGRWYYLDLATGEMLTGWQLIPGWGYMYLNPFAEAQTWFYDEASGMWVYDTENTKRPYGSLYMNEKTPDGYFVDENGVWKEN